MNVVRVLARPSPAAVERIRARLSDDPEVRYVAHDDAAGMIEVLVETESFDAIREGEIRALVLSLLAEQPGDEVADLRRRVVELEGFLAAVASKVGVDRPRVGPLQDRATQGHAGTRT